jgi:hypothetical protein
VICFHFVSKDSSAGIYDTIYNGHACARDGATTSLASRFMLPVGFSVALTFKPNRVLSGTRVTLYIYDEVDIVDIGCNMQTSRACSPFVAGTTSGQTVMPNADGAITMQLSGSVVTFSGANTVQMSVGAMVTQAIAIRVSSPQETLQLDREPSCVTLSELIAYKVITTTSTTTTSTTTTSRTTTSTTTTSTTTSTTTTSRTTTSSQTTTPAPTTLASTALPTTATLASTTLPSTTPKATTVAPTTTAPPTTRTTTTTTTTPTTSTTRAPTTTTFRSTAAPTIGLLQSGLSVCLQPMTCWI